MQAKNKFATKFGIIAATVGSAVGLGNIWRFPYECGAGGGGAFLLAYFGFVIVLGIPVICAEFIIGRSTGENVSGAFRALGVGRFWHIIGTMGIIASFAILGFYTVVAGWCVDYIYQAATGFGGAVTQQQLHEQFEAFNSSGWKPLLWTLLFLFLNFLIISWGVQKGIERMSNLMLPLLFVILLAFCVNSLFLPGFEKGFDFLFKADFSKFTPDMLLSAMGQAFFSLSIGMGVLITYASYFKHDTQLIKTSSIIGGLDTLVAIMAAFIIFPACFSYNMDPAAGPTLIFEVLPSIFQQMLGGMIWGTLFFLLLFLATITSTISITEVVVAWLEGEWHISRKKATVLYGVIISIVAAICSLSFGPLKGVTIFGMNMFNFLDYLSAKVLLPLGGMLISVFVGWVLDKGIIRRELVGADEAPDGRRHPAMLVAMKCIVFSLKYFAPPAILIILVAGIF